MEDLAKLRYRNARTLIYTIGSIRRIALMMGEDEDLIQEYIGLYPCRSIDEAFARALELAVGKATGWLDLDQTPGLTRPVVQFD